jgi:hypothetical protein
MTWLKLQPVNTHDARRRPTDDDVRSLIRTEITKNRGFIGQEEGAKIVRERYPGYNKKRAMAFVKEATKNDKPGPKGPRK